jgi:hypothetical protein
VVRFRVTFSARRGKFESDAASRALLMKNGAEWLELARIYRVEGRRRPCLMSKATDTPGISTRANVIHTNRCGGIKALFKNSKRTSMSHCK